MTNYRSDKFSVVPSRSTSLQMKSKFDSTQRSFKILKSKHEAINFKLAQIKAESARLFSEFIESMQDAKLMLARAKFSCLDIPQIIAQSAERVDAKICVKVQNLCIAGACFPKLVYVEQTSPEIVPFFGLARGGEEVAKVRKAFRTTLEILINVASSIYSYTELKKQARSERQRINAIEFVLLPKILNTLRYVDDELDEQNREEFYRLKRAKSKVLKYAQLRDESAVKRCSSVHQETSALRLFEEDDEDVLF